MAVKRRTFRVALAPSSRSAIGSRPVRQSTEGFIMVRWSVLAASAAVIAGAAFVTGASIPPKPVGGLLKLDTPKAAVGAIGQKTGYFNMAAIMRGYKRATTAVERLN